ncbi:MAG: toll/interleukin-1 receptor domain-containing protein, partial [Enterobacterales bacterium]|nr:toll/interleukin-1 receptor domain-containing protein [Enterobacterales bacterium]
MIFISYSSKDGDIANKICEGLEAKQHHCWIAPRDINPGESYPSAIMRGLNECKVMLIIVSDNSILSRHVLNEVEQAFKSETAIIPVRIADIVPSGDLDYFLSLTQWFDVISGDVEQHIDDLATKIRPLVAQGNESVSSTVASPPQPIPDPKPEPEPKSKSSSKPLLMALIAIIVVILGFLIYSFMPAPEPTMDGFTEAVMVDEAIPNREINIKISTEPNKSIYHDGDKIILSVTTE